MTPRLSTTAASPLGAYLALIAAAVPLLIVGACLALNDAPIGGISPLHRVLYAFLSDEQTQQSAAKFVDDISLRFKNYSHVERIAYFGIALFAAFILQKPAARFLRAYRFTFSRSAGILERQALWLCIPLWLAAYLLLALLTFAALRTSATLTLHPPLWFALTLAAAAAAAALGYAWAPDTMNQTMLKSTILKRTIPVPLAAPLLAAAALLAALLGILAHLSWILTLPIPLRPLLAALLPLLILLPSWFFAPNLLRQNLFIPGLKKRIPFSQIKKLEITPEPEGAPTLTITLKNNSAWTLQRASLPSLHRSSSALAKIIGLPRRDLVTWV